MKLWQLVFLCSLALILAAGGTVSTAVLHRSFSVCVLAAEEQAVALHGEYGLSLARGENGDALQSHFAAVCLRETNGAWQDGELPGGFPQDFIDALEQTDGCLAYTYRSGDEVFLTVGSRLSDGRLLLTTADVSALYTLYRGQMRRAVRLSLCFSLLFSTGLALLVWFFCTKPLGKVNRTLKRLAGGDYDRRLSENGVAEYRILSKNVNLLAASVEEQTRTLQEIADSRKRFADNMAHEMKTPLTSILCMADLLRIKRSVTEHERQDYAGVIQEEARRMQALSSKLLTLARADSSAPDFRQTSLSDLLSDVRNAMQPILDKRQIRLTFAGEEITVRVDKQLFKTLLMNLIDNAAKASSDGQRILVCYTVREKQLQLAVIDEGIGMNAQEVRRATEAFWMADKSRSRKAGGAGLGLALCKEIAALHGAQMTISSEPNRGTTVHLQMPLEKE